MIEWKDNLAQSFATAICELELDEAAATEFASLTNEAILQSRLPKVEWRRLLKPIALIPSYEQWNELRHDKRSVAFHAIEAYDYISSIRETADAKAAIPSPKKFLVEAREEIVAQFEDPIRRLCRSPFRGRFSQIILAAPEFADALMQITRGRRATAAEMLEAIDAALQQRGTNGRPPDKSRSDAYCLLREHYTWLTGRPPCWTNSLGVPEGDYVEFAQSVYRASGIAEVTHLMLRPARPKRGPRRKSVPAKT